MWNHIDIAYISRNMKKLKLSMHCALFIIVILIFQVISPSTSTISDKRLCYDPDCSEVVSLGKTTVKYNAIDRDILSFGPNVDVKIYSKNAGSREDLWGVEIGGKRGYAPLLFIRENKVLHKDLKHEVPTGQYSPKSSDNSKKVKDETDSIIDDNLINNENETGLPLDVNQVSPSFEVIDGTTIYLTPKDSEEENNYATKNIQNPSQEMEQPILSVLPNLMSSKILLEKTLETQNINTEKLPEKILTTTNDNKVNVDNEITSSEKASENVVSETLSETSPEKLAEVSHSDADEEKKQEDTGTIQNSENEDLQDDNDDEDDDDEDYDEKIGEKSEDSQNNVENNKQELSEESTGNKAEQAESDTVTNTFANVFGKVTSYFEGLTTTVSPDSETVEKSVEKITSSNKDENSSEITNNPSTDEQTPQVAKPLLSEVTEPETRETQSIEVDKQVLKEEESQSLKVNKEILENIDVPSVITSDKIESEVSESSEQNSQNEIKPLQEAEKISVEEGASLKRIDKILDVASEVVNKISDTVPEAANKVPDIILEATNKVPDIVPEATNKVPDIIPEATNKVPDIVPEATNKVPDIVPEATNKVPDVPPETNDKIPEISPEVVEKPLVTAEKVPKKKTPAPIPKLKKFSYPSRSEEVEETTELPATKLPEKVQQSMETSTVEIIEEASGTTETSVRLDSIDPPTDEEKFLENLSENLINQTNQETIFSDNDYNGGINNIIKKDKVIDDDKLNETNTQDHIIKVEEEIMTHYGQPGINEGDELSGSSRNLLNHISSFNEFPGSRNLLNVQSEPTQDSSESIDNNKSEILISDTIIASVDKESLTNPSDKQKETISSTTVTSDVLNNYSEEIEEKNMDTTIIDDINHVIFPSEVCNAHNNCDESVENKLSQEEKTAFENEKEVIHAMEQGQNYWETLSYLTLTALTTLLFSLGYFYIENTRRDGQLIAKINKLEKELLISSKENTVLDETLNSTKTKLNSIEDESFGSNEMVSSFKADLEAANQTKIELENQVSALEKDLESATEAGLELERMLREILTAKNEENPLAKTIEDLQTRLDAQQSANKSLTNALQLKTQENDSLKNELAANVQKCGQLELEVTRLSQEFKSVTATKQQIEEGLTKKVEELEKRLAEITEQRRTLKTQLKSKEMEVKDLSEIVKKTNINHVDLTKLSEVSKMKAVIDQLKEEKDELKIKLSEVEGAHDLLEEHSKTISKEIKSLTDQIKTAIKEKEEAETRLEVLTKFFQEKEAERQKEEAIWAQKQGEASTTVEKMQILQNEIQNYKQQIETLKREVLDQEKEYKTQITALEAKAHDQWVRARQSERRLEESKAESGQLRNRLTLIEKNISDNESEAKTHRLESNGETATSPQLFIGAESSSSPLMFTGPSSIPFLYGPHMPPFLSSHMPTLPGYDVGQRPPSLGRLSSPPPIPINASGPLRPPPPPLHTSNNRYDHSGSSPSPPISPSIIPPPHGHFRSNHPPPPPIPSFPNDRIPPVPLPGMLPPPHLSNTSWGEDKLSSRNNGSFHPFQRDQHPRDYKDLPEESVDRSRRSGKM